MSVARALVVLALLVVGLALAGALLYFVSGSLETFATDEQRGKARLSAGALAALLVLVEVGLWRLLVRLRRRSPPASPRDGARPRL